MFARVMRRCAEFIALVFGRETCIQIGPSAAEFVENVLFIVLVADGVVAVELRARLIGRKKRRRARGNRQGGTQERESEESSGLSNGVEHW